jgi:hypothetical protein
LKARQGKSEVVNGERAGKTMTKRNRTKRQTIDDITLHRKRLRPMKTGSKLRYSGKIIV